MPEVKNTFLKSKMNKDLDARILPNGEYRDAQNVNVSKSEGEDVGSLENVLSNIQISNVKNDIIKAEILNFSGFGAPPTEDQIEKALDTLEIIGKFMDVRNDRIFLMLTNYNDTSPDRISNFASSDGINFAGNFIYKGACCYICEYNVSTSTNTILVAGNFLNFSKTHKILSINILEDLLFWTDDRNQPRKINIQRAINQSYSSGDPYYYNEDQISVAKFAPVLPISLIEEVSANNWQSTMESATQEYLPIHLIDTVRTSQGGGGNTIEMNRTFSSGTSNSLLKIDDRVVIENSDGEEFEYTVSSVGGGSTTDTVLINGTFADQGLSSVEVGYAVKFQRENPFYDVNYVGDENTLKDKFVRFSYRFKYDDNEYSLFAPFTQEVFIPKQFGYFIDNDESKTGKSGIVSFMENLIDKVKFNIRLPYFGDQIEDILKVKEIQIVSKASDEQAVKVIEDILVSDLTNTQDYLYEYNAIKPYKTLPENELTRVHDKVPVRAKCQEVTSNRVIYGNFVDKHTSPDFLDYENAVNIKANLNDGTSGVFNQIKIEYPNHTLKQNRNYSVGVVLMDRYGRPSNVILSKQASVSNEKVSTVYSPYRNTSGSKVQSWPGDILDIVFNQPIPESGPDGYPGLYSQTNPLGWYSYKIVVKQQEQEYYNVYVAGILAGEISWTTTPIEYDPNETPAIEPAQDETAQNQPNYINSTNTSLISLFGDNINKIPRNLNEVGTTDMDFGSSTLLFNRVNPNSWISNIFDSSGIFSQGVPYNIQSNVNSTPDTIDFIKPFKQFGEWTTTKGNLYPGQQFNQDNLPFKDPWYPFTGVINTDNDASGLQFKDPLFKANENPFIASISTQFKTGVQPKKYIDTPNNYEFYRNTGSTRLGDTTLGVYETNPTESLLELFWETSTAGLIKQDNYILTSNQYQGLNDLIDSNIGSPGPVNLSQINFVLNEADVSGTDALSLEFELLDGSNNPCADPLNSITILSVKDGYGNERKKDFNINNTNIPLDPKKWMITSNNTFVYNQDANVRENYTFYLECTANNITNTISFSGSLSNTDPVNISFPDYVRANPPFSSTTSFQFDNSLAPQDVTILAVGEIENGSVKINKKTEQLTYGVSIDPSDGYNNNFTNYTDANGNVILSYDGGIPISGTPSSVTIPATLTVNDANGNGGNIQIPFEILVLG
jgi:hypothetical protein